MSELSLLTFVLLVILNTSEVSSKETTFSDLPRPEGHSKSASDKLLAVRKDGNNHDRLVTNRPDPYKRQNPPRDNFWPYCKLHKSKKKSSKCATRHKSAWPQFCSLARRRLEPICLSALNRNDPRADVGFKVV